MLERMTVGKLYEQVVNQICRMILDGTLKKGDYLPSENKMCRQFGVSRTTVREALRVLGEQGIVETAKGKGTRILTDNKNALSGNFHEMVNDLHAYFESCMQVRNIIEPEIAYQIAQNAEKTEFDDMERALIDTQAKIVMGTVQSDDLRKFHRMLVAAMHNPVLDAIYENITNVSDAFEEVDFTEASQDTALIQKSFEEHRKIFDAVRARDGRRAYFYMMEHLQKTSVKKRNVFDYVAPIFASKEETGPSR